MRGGAGGPGPGNGTDGAGRGGYRPGGGDPALRDGFARPGPDRAWGGRERFDRAGDRGPGRFEDRRAWSTDWRRDARFNPYGWRRSHHERFVLPRYAPPSGWWGGYRRFAIGVGLDAPFFAPDYWIDDPWEYRLPPAYGDLRWIRYYGDALLVDVDTGEVVDVVYGLFY